MRKYTNAVWISILINMWCASLCTANQPEPTIVSGPDGQLDRIMLFARPDVRNTPNDMLWVELSEGKGIIERDLSSVTLAEAEKRWGSAERQTSDEEYMFKVLGVRTTPDVEPYKLHLKFLKDHVVAYKIKTVENDLLKDDTWISVSAYKNAVVLMTLETISQWNAWHRDLTKEAWRKFAELAPPDLLRDGSFYVKVEYDVKVDGTTANVRIVGSNANKTFEQCALDSVNSLNHSPLLRFPVGSNRTIVRKLVTLKLTKPDPASTPAQSIHF